jgi:hypothetical protein
MSSENLRRAVSYYAFARSRILSAGFGAEVRWQQNLDPQLITESDLLRETAWVVLCSGFRESVVRARFSQISLCFCDWESSSEIVSNAEVCRETALACFGNQRKISAILAAALIVFVSGFHSIKERILRDPIPTLMHFDQVGGITAYHLAKNLGFPLAKQDRHLARLSQLLGFENAENLCSAVSHATGDPVHAVDIVFWRDSVLHGPAPVGA